VRRKSDDETTDIFLRFLTLIIEIHKTWANNNADNTREKTKREKKASSQTLRLWQKDHPGIRVLSSYSYE